MAIQLKYSANTSTPSSLANGEPAYATNGEVLFIGSNSDVIAIGGKRVPGTGMKTARKLASGEVDLEQLKLMSAWFARHGESPKETKARKDKTSKAAVAWALWGGTPGRAWVNRTIKKLED